MTKRVRTTRRLEVWLKDTSVPLFVLNAHRRLVFFNAGCELLTGWTPADVLGQVCDYLSEADSFSSNALLASLAPPGQVWQGESVVVPARLARREAQPLDAVFHFFSLTDGSRKVQAALGIIQPATTLDATHVVPTSLKLHTQLAELRSSIRQKFGEDSVIGCSPSMRRVLEQIQVARKSSLPVAFVGDHGTGREHIARMIHLASERARDAFVPLDCHLLTNEQLETTLRKIFVSGASSEIQPGTVYLHHVDELPRDLQKVVLEWIESRNPKSVRVMAASLVPLERSVESGHFLRELFYALTPIVISVPLLRHRPEDLEPLAQYFLEESNRGAAHQISGFHDAVLQQFRRYNWPGNVAELRSVVLEARNLCKGPIIELDHLPFQFRTGVRGQTVGLASRPRAEPLEPLLLRVEREQIDLALNEARQNKAKAAELLGITRPRLYRRMEFLGIIDRDSSDELPAND